MASSVQADRIVGAGPEKAARHWPSWQVPARAMREWHQLAASLALLEEQPACEGQPELWWERPSTPAGQRAEESAVAECALCPVVAACASYAIAAGEREGVWGGMTAAERRTAVAERA